MPPSASRIRMKPAPKIETIIGSTTVRAKAVATAASKALPPRANISSPASEASGWFAATTASLAITSCLRSANGRLPMTGPGYTLGQLEEAELNKTQKRALRKRLNKARNKRLRAKGQVPVLAVLSGPPPPRPGQPARPSAAAGAPGARPGPGPPGAGRPRPPGPPGAGPSGPRPGGPPGPRPGGPPPRPVGGPPGGPPRPGPGPGAGPGVGPASPAGPGPSG